VSTARLSAPKSLSFCRLDIDIRKNEPHVAGCEERSGATEHGKFGALGVDFEQVDRREISFVAELRGGLEANGNRAFVLLRSDEVKGVEGRVGLRGQMKFAVTIGQSEAVHVGVGLGAEVLPQLGERSGNGLERVNLRGGITGVEGLGSLTDVGPNVEDQAGLPVRPDGAEGLIWIDALGQPWTTIEFVAASSEGALGSFFEAAGETHER
jgi:hypothetical protein